MATNAKLWSRRAILAKAAKRIERAKDFDEVMIAEADEFYGTIHPAPDDAARADALTGRRRPAQQNWPEH